VRIRLRSGAWLESVPTTAPGDPARPLGDAELLEKFRTLTGPGDATRFKSIAAHCLRLDDDPTGLAELVEGLYQPLMD
jgi:hypothetical protein